jgi:hypothetical protein
VSTPVTALPLTGSPLALPTRALTEAGPRGDNRKLCLSTMIVTDLSKAQCKHVCTGMRQLAIARGMTDVTYIHTAYIEPL